MSFKGEKRPYTKENILNLKPAQNGVYGIFRGNQPVYVGSGDIRERMLAHVNGDNRCINQNSPNWWTGILINGDPTRKEGELIQEYNPVCNIVIPR